MVFAQFAVVSHIFLWDLEKNTYTENKRWLVLRPKLETSAFKE
jgi:hypothetical protein